MRLFPKLILPLTMLALVPLMPPLAEAQSAGAVEDSTPWNPEEVPAQTVFEYGAATEPTLICSPNKYCGLALQTGEQVQSFAANEDDWSVTVTTYGAGKLAKPVLLVTPLAVGVSDELTVQSRTGREQARSYKIKLVSDATKWMQVTTFRYPDNP